MKSSLLALFMICGLLNVAFSTQQLNSQGKMITQNIREKMEKSHLGRAFLNMVQMNAEMGYEAQDLFEALQMLRDNLVEKKDAENLDFVADGEAHQREVARIQGLIDLAQSQVTTFNEELEGLEAAGKTLEDQLVAQQNQLTLAVQTKEGLEGSLTRLDENLESETKDFNDAIELLGRAIGKLENYLSGGDQPDVQSEDPATVALVQKRNKEYQNIANMLEKKIIVANKHNNQPFYVAPLAKVFTQITSENKEENPDPSNVERAIGALKGLKEYFQEGLNTLNAEYEKEKEKTQNLLDNTVAEIDLVTKVLIPKTNEDIEANKINVEAKESEIADAESSIRLETKNLEEENESWSKRVEMHNTLIPEYDAEFKIVQQAEVILRNQFGAVAEEEDDEVVDVE